MDGDPETLDQLRDRLTDEDRKSFSIDGERQDDTFVVEHRGAGWLVLYWERGTKRDFVKHASEAAACQDVWRRSHGLTE
jgi:hypothetical protein